MGQKGLKNFGLRQVGVSFLFTYFSALVAFETATAGILWGLTNAVWTGIQITEPKPYPPMAMLAIKPWFPDKNHWNEKKCMVQ